MSKEESACHKLGIPEYLHRNNRPTVPFADNEEVLFRRFTDEDFDRSTKKFHAAKFRSDGMSCNRSTLSREPEDVLFDTKNGQHFVDSGIYAMPISEIQQITIAHSDLKDVNIHCPIEHKPEECMYPHTEVSIQRSDSGTVSKPSKVKIKEAYRHICKIIRLPGGQ